MPAELARALENNLRAVVVSDVLITHTHDIADPVQAVLELLCSKEVEPCICPLLSHVSLW